MTTKRFMPDWQDGDRTWTDLGNNVEASLEFPGSHRIDLRRRDSHQRLLTISKDMLDQLSALFNLSVSE